MKTLREIEQAFKTENVSTKANALIQLLKYKKPYVGGITNTQRKALINQLNDNVKQSAYRKLNTNANTGTKNMMRRFIANPERYEDPSARGQSRTALTNTNVNANKTTLEKASSGNQRSLRLLSTQQLVNLTNRRDINERIREKIMKLLLEKLEFMTLGLDQEARIRELQKYSLEILVPFQQKLATEMKNTALQTAVTQAIKNKARMQVTGDTRVLNRYENSKSSFDRSLRESKFNNVARRLGKGMNTGYFTGLKNTSNKPNTKIDLMKHIKTSLKNTLRKKNESSLALSKALYNKKSDGSPFISPEMALQIPDVLQLADAVITYFNEFGEFKATAITSLQQASNVNSIRTAMQTLNKALIASQQKYENKMTRSMLTNTKLQDPTAVLQPTGNNAGAKKANAGATFYKLRKNASSWNMNTAMTREQIMAALENGNFALTYNSQNKPVTMRKQGNNFVRYVE